jgi:hypothetical protein
MPRIINFLKAHYSSDSSVSTAKGYGFNSWQGKRFPLLHSVQTVCGAHRASYPMGKEERIFPQGYSGPGRETDHSCPSSAEVNNG